MRPRLSARFAGLLPEGVAAFELAGAGDPALLLPGEREHVFYASRRRAAEFSAGRQCARHAAAHHGEAPVAIGARADGRPQWPAHLTGSITHTAGLAAAAVGERRHFRAVGIDVERVSAVSPELWGHIFSPAEALALRALPLRSRTAVAALTFSAKETYYKCRSELSRRWLEFRDLSVDFGGQDLAGGSGECEVRMTGRLEQAAPAAVRYRFSGGLVMTAMVLAAR